MAKKKVLVNKPIHADAVRRLEEEAEVLAAEIRKLAGAGTMVHERVQDGQRPGNSVWRQRPAGYGDCAVLIHSRSRLKDYEAALQKAGVPFRVVGGIGFYEEDEIQALLNVASLYGTSPWGSTCCNQPCCATCAVQGP